MPVFFPDILQHNNPNLAIADSDNIRGGRKVVPNLTALYALSEKPDLLKQYVTMVFVESESQDFLLIDITKANSADGWRTYAITEIVEKLPVTALNTITPLTHAPLNPGRTLLMINGIIYDALEGDPAFTVVGNQITWHNNTVGFDLPIDARVLVRYFI